MSRFMGAPSFSLIWLGWILEGDNPLALAPPAQGWGPSSPDWGFKHHLCQGWCQWEIGISVCCMERIGDVSLSEAIVSAVLHPFLSSIGPLHTVDPAP